PAVRRRVAVVLAGLVLVLGVCNVTIYQREQLLAHGQVAILELAPVDPRSLMQGDYMALRFTAGTAVAKLRQADEQTATDGYLILSPDARGVAQPLRIQAKVDPHAAPELVLRYRVRPDGVRIVTNAYFFPEGEAARYERARYGEVRLDGSGTGLLVRMLGEDLKPL
ncbi:GDYXXLXY domain-containing protein, partial [Bordetella hinzii]